MITPVDKDKNKNKISTRDVISKFISYYKPYKAIFIIDILCALTLTAVDLAYPQFLRLCTSDLFTRSPEEIMQIIGGAAIALIIIYIIRSAAQYYVSYWGHYMGASMEADMRRDLFNQYQRLSFSYYDKNNSGEMITRILTDLFDIGELAHHGPENIFISFIKIIGSFILLFMLNPALSTVMFFVTLLMFIVAIKLNIKTQSAFRENRESMADMGSQLSDSLGGIKTVKSFGNEDLEMEKFSTYNNEYLSTRKKSYKYIAKLFSSNSMFTGLLYIITIVGGGYCVATGSLAVNELAIFAIYIGIIIAPIDLLVQFTETLQKGYAGFKRLLQILNEKPDVVEDKNAYDFPQNSNTNIKYKDVTFSYEPKKGSTKEIQNFNLNVEEGHKIALVGPSGQGKSTVCALLPRFYDCLSGKITIGGHDIKKLTISSLRDAIGFVSQDIYLFDNSIIENIAYANPRASKNEVINAAKKACIHDFITTLPDGYDTRVGERGARLSGGQKQRLAIARLILRNPKIIVLDEATSALDNESEAAVQISLDNLCKGRTTIIIAHRLSTIKSVDKIAVINDGKLAELGTHSQLLDKGGIYAKYYKMQFIDNNNS